MLALIFGSSLVAAVVSQFFQHRNWLIQKKREQRLDIANRFLLSIQEFDNASTTSKSDAAKIAVQQLALLRVAEVISERAEVKAIISFYIRLFVSVISHGPQHPDGTQMASRRNALAAALYGEAFGVSRSKMKAIYDEAAIHEAVDKAFQRIRNTPEEDISAKTPG